jgi:hypothetical protein
MVISLPEEDSSMNKYAIAFEVYSDYMKEFAEGKTTEVLFINWFQDKLVEIDKDKPSINVNKCPSCGYYFFTDLPIEKKEYTSDELALTPENMPQKLIDATKDGAKELVEKIEEHVREKILKIMCKLPARFFQDDSKWIESVKELYKCLPKDKETKELQKRNLSYLLSMIDIMETFSTLPAQKELLKDLKFLIIDDIIKIKREEKK